MANSLDFKLIISAQNRAKGAFRSAERSMDSLGNKVKKVSQQSRQVGTMFTAAGAAIVASAAVSVKAFQEQERAEARLEQVSRQVTGSSDAQIQSFKDQAAALQAVGVVGDEVLIAGQSQIASFAKSSSTVTELTDDIADLAVSQYGTNVSQEQAIQTANKLGKALKGQLGALTLTGITVNGEFKKAFENATTEQERAVVISKIVQDNYGGLNEKMRETSQGGIQVMTNSFGDLVEMIGELLIPAVSFLVDVISPLIDRASEWIEENQSLARVIGLVTLALGGLLLVTGALLIALSFLPNILLSIQLMLGLIAGTVLSVNLPLIALIAVIGIFTVAVVRNFEDVKLSFLEMKDTAIDIANSVRNSFHSMRDGVLGALSPIIEMTQRFSHWVQTILSDLKNKAATLGVSIFNALGSGFASAFPRVSSFITDALSFISDKFTGFISGFKDFVGKLGGVGEKMGVFLGVDSVVGAFDSISDKFSSFKDVFTGGFDELKSDIPITATDIADIDIPVLVDQGTAAGAALSDGVSEAIAEAAELVEERTEEIITSFETLKQKTKNAWSEFQDSTDDAKKTYRDTIDSIKESTKELKASFKSDFADIVSNMKTGIQEIKTTFEDDFANTILDIQDNISGLNATLSETNLSFDEDIASKFVDAEEEIANATTSLNDELLKDEESRSQDTIDGLNELISEKEAFLEKHADTLAGLEDTTAEVRRVRGLDEIELLIEQKSAEAAILEESIATEQAILDAHKDRIQEHNDAITEQVRVRGLDDIELLIEQKSNEIAALKESALIEEGLLKSNYKAARADLRSQEKQALKIKRNAAKRARRMLRNNLKGIAADSRVIIGQMAAEYQIIPDSMGEALNQLSSRLITAGTQISGGGNTTSTTDNSKNITIEINGTSGESQDELLARLDLMLGAI